MPHKPSPIAEELVQIQKAHRGLLRPVDVVAFARNPKTALHAQFDWEDSVAAEKWRLRQAQEVIRLSVTVISSKVGSVRAFVSLSSDRQKKGGGYRAVVDVLDDAGLLRQMLADAFDDLRAFKDKYEKLKQLQPIWKAMNKVEKLLPRSSQQQPERKAA